MQWYVENTKLKHITTYCYLHAFNQMWTRYFAVFYLRIFACCYLNCFFPKALWYFFLNLACFVLIFINVLSPYQIRKINKQITWVSMLCWSLSLLVSDVIHSLSIFSPSSQDWKVGEREDAECSVQEEWLDRCVRRAGGVWASAGGRKKGREWVFHPLISSYYQLCDHCSLCPANGVNLYLYDL